MLNAVIATTTFSKAYDLRAKLAVKTAREAKRLGYNMVIVDGGSPPEFLLDLRSTGAMVLPQIGRTMGESRRQAMAEAFRLSNKGIVVWTEPEKYTFISQIAKVLKDQETFSMGLAIPGRSSLDTYPVEQQWAEKLGIRGFNYLVQPYRDRRLKPLDMWFGPRSIGPEAIKFFLEYEGEYGDTWDATHVPVLRCIMANLNVLGVEVEYVHPPEQTAEESESFAMLMKRVEQLNNLLPAFRKEAEKLDMSQALY